MIRYKTLISTLACFWLTPLTSALSFNHTEVEAKSWWTQKQYKRYETRTLSEAEARQAEASKLSRYGGRLDRRLASTGFFRCEQHDGRWIMVDPDGYEWFQVGCNSVRRNPTRNGQAALQQRYGSTDAWAQQTVKLLRELGYNSLGNWSELKEIQASVRFPYTKGLDFMATFGRRLGISKMGYGHHKYEGDVMPVFHPDFPAFCQEYAAEHCANLKQDPWLVGYFSDNELPLTEDVLDKYLALPEDNPNYQATVRWLKQQDLAVDQAFSAEQRSAFLQHVVDTYCRLVSSAIREVDPYHLYFGCRFLGRDAHLDALWKGAGPYVDVISLNLYKVWTPDPKKLDQWTQWSGRPFIITEWYAKGMDTGMDNKGGAGWIVKTQDDRGRFYQNFTLGLLEHPACVGWHWFKYMDNDPTDAKADSSNKDSNKGFVTAHYEAYEDLLPWMEAINGRVYSLRDQLVSKVR